MLKSTWWCLWQEDDDADDDGGGGCGDDDAVHDVDNMKYKNTSDGKTQQIFKNVIFFTNDFAA